jgi:hypothetical protein
VCGRAGKLGVGNVGISNLGILNVPTLKEGIGGVLNVGVGIENVGIEWVPWYMLKSLEAAKL